MEYINCPICNSKEYRPVYKNKHYFDYFSGDYNDDFKCTSYEFSSYYQIVECKKCGLYYNNPRDDTANLTQAYTDIIDPDYIVQESGREKTYTEILATLKKIKNEGKLLDIGCYVGFFLKLASEFGYTVTGLEPCKWAAEYGKKNFRLDIKNKPFLEYDFNQKFDIITMWDVIEHLPDISEVFKKCNKIMNKNGIIAFSTHNINSAIARILKSKYPFIMRMHIAHFSPMTINYLLNRNGFKLIRLEKHKRYLKLDYFLKQLKSYSYFLSYLLKPVKLFLPENYLIKIDQVGLINCWAKKIKEI